MRGNSSRVGSGDGAVWRKTRRIRAKRFQFQLPFILGYRGMIIWSLWISSSLGSPPVMHRNSTAGTNHHHLHRNDFMNDDERERQLELHQNLVKAESSIGTYGCFVQAPPNLETNQKQQQSQTQNNIYQLKDERKGKKKTENRSKKGNIENSACSTTKNSKESKKNKSGEKKKNKKGKSNKNIKKGCDNADRRQNQCQQKIRRLVRRSKSFSTAIDELDADFQLDSLVVLGDDWSDIGMDAISPICSLDPDLSGVYCNTRNSNGPLIPEYLAVYFNIGPLQMSVLPAGNNYAMTGATTTTKTTTKTATKNFHTNNNLEKSRNDNIEKFYFSLDGGLNLIQSQLDQYRMDVSLSTKTLFRSSKSTSVPLSTNSSSSDKLTIVGGGGGGGFVKPIELSAPTPERLHIITVGTNILLDAIRSYVLYHFSPKSTQMLPPQQILKNGTIGFRQFLKSILRFPQVCNLLVFSPMDVSTSPLVVEYLTKLKRHDSDTKTENKQDDLLQNIQQFTKKLSKSFEKEVRKVENAFATKCRDASSTAKTPNAEFGIQLVHSSKLAKRVMHHYYNDYKTGTSCNSRYVVPQSVCESSATLMVHPELPWISSYSAESRTARKSEDIVWCQLPVVPTQSCHCGGIDDDAERNKNEKNQRRRPKQTAVWFDEYHFTSEFNEYMAQEAYVDMVVNKVCNMPDSDDSKADGKRIIPLKT